MGEFKSFTLHVNACAFFIEWPDAELNRLTNPANAWRGGQNLVRRAGAAGQMN